MPDNTLDLEFYRNFYSDLIELSDDELVGHWERHGKNEIRQPNFEKLLSFLKVDTSSFPKDIKAKEYLKLNSDLASNVPENYYQAILDYLSKDCLPNGDKMQTSKTYIRHSKTRKKNSHIDQVKTFKITGWSLLIHKQSIDRKLQIKINDRVLDVDFVMVERKDVAKALKLEFYDLGFELHIPGYIWCYAQKQETTTLSLYLNNDELIVEKTIQLSHEILISWLEKIVNYKEGLEKQFLSLLALEHIKFAEIIEELPVKTGIFFTNFAEQMQLNNFLSTTKPELETTYKSISQKEIINFDRDIVWTCQKKLNDLLVEDNADIFEKIHAVFLQLKGNEKHQINFIKSVIPFLAKHNELIKIKPYINFSDYFAFDSDNAFDKSLAVALLVVDKKINEASKHIEDLSTISYDGWLNTECLYFAITHMQQLEENGQIEPAAADQLREAVIGFLESFKGEWFSRLHDKMLRNMMIEMLNKLALMSDYHGLNVVKSAIKIYGLSSDFWLEIEQRSINIQNSFFINAYRHWQIIYEAFNDISLLSLNFSKIVHSIQYFHQQGNLEAIIFLRELLMTALSSQLKINIDDCLDIIEPIAESDIMEVIRLVANPEIEDKIALKLIEKYETQIFDALRLNAECSTSKCYRAQIKAANILTKHSSESHLLEQVLTPIRNWETMFLNTDVLMTYLVNNPQEVEKTILKLDGAIQKVIVERNIDFYLPAPVCTALATAKRLSHDNVFIKNWLNYIEHLIETKFGELYASLFTECKSESLTQLGWPQDTLVVIYSCRRYLDSRIKAIRKTWLKALKARNIPYVILVGDGNDQIEGDVLALNVSDTYEDLPLKTLKLFDWVYNNTNAQYVLKIDDDCHLDVEQYFNSLSYRKHHYYGRVLRRGVGDMNRTWHHSKSKTEYAQKSIDKSPEPAIYADGGGAYCLSRIAVNALIQNVQSIQGRKLISISFMEDKLVGDLLAMSHIKPSNEDYLCYQRRRTFAAATPVGMGDNTFFPSASVPTQVTHLDTDKDQPRIEQNKNATGLWPKKIWPSCFEANVRFNSNQLELLSSQEKSKRLLNEQLTVVSVMRNEMLMLPHFLKHYRDLGIKLFIIADNCSDDGTREYLLHQSDVLLYSVDTEYKHSHYGVAWQQAILANHCVGKWTLLADADELLIYDNYQHSDLSELVRQVESEGADCVRTDMVDMYPYGDLSEADLTKHSPFEVANWHDKEPLIERMLNTGLYSNRMSSVSRLRHRFDGNAEPNAYTSQKYALIKYKPWIRLSQGIHDISGVKLYSVKAMFAHFKYHAGFKEKVIEEIQRKQHYGNAKEYRRYAKVLAEVKGGFGGKDSTQLFYKKESIG